jgi:hypothetical protein
LVNAQQDYEVFQTCQSGDINLQRFNLYARFRFPFSGGGFLSSELYGHSRIC